MTKPVITETIVADDPTKVTGSIRLYARDGGGGTAYTYGGSTVTVGQVIRISYNSSGVLKADDGTTALQLNPNVNTSGTNTDAIVTPTGTVWQLETRYPGVRTPEVRYLTIPDEAGPLNVVDVLTDPPGSILSAGAQAYTDAQIAALPGQNQIADQRILGNTSGTTAFASAQAPTTVRTIVAQDITRRGGKVYRGRITTQLVVDVVIGDSIGRGVGGTLGSTDWPALLAAMENRAAGLEDAPGGIVLCNEDESVYGNFKWSSLSVGAAGTTGPSALAGGNPNTNWVTSANAQVIGDSRTFRRAHVFYELQASSAASIQISVDGGSNYSTDQSTTGSGYAQYTSADIGATTGTLRVKQTSAGTAKIIGYRPLPTAGTSGLVIDNLCHGGTATTDWLSSRGWETYCTLVSPRRIFISLGGNDMFAGTSAATTATNLGTIITRAKAAAPLAEIVVICAYYPSKPTAGKTGVGFSTWTGTWVPAIEGAALTGAATFIDLTAAFGDCSEGVDPYTLTMDAGLHFGPAGQRAIAELVAERLGVAGASVSGLPRDGSLPITGHVDIGSYDIRSGGVRKYANKSIDGTDFATSGTITTAAGGRIAWGDLISSPYWAIYSNSTDANPSIFLWGATISTGPGSGGAVARVRYLSGLTAAGAISGATTSGSSASGAANLGDLGWDQTGSVFICTTAGTPGTWTNVLRSDGTTLELNAAVLRVKALGIDTAQLAASAVTSAKIATGTIVNSNVSSSAALDWSKLALSGTIQMATARLAIGELGGIAYWAIYANSTDANPLSFWYGGTWSTGSGGASSVVARLGHAAGSTQTGGFRGDTATVAPSSGSYTTGDFVVGQNGTLYVCTAGGSPGTWVDLVTRRRLDEMAAPTGSVGFGSQKGTSMAAGTAATDSAVISQLPGAAIATGRYTCLDHSSRTTLSVTQNRAYAARIIISKATTFTSAGVEVVTTAAGASGVCYVSLYAESAGQPSGAAVATSSSIDVTSTGYKEVTSQSMTIATPGNYWVVVHFNGSATVPTLRATTTPTYLSSTPGADPSGGTPSAGVRSSSDNWSSTAPSWAGTAVVSTVPIAWLKS